MNYVEKIRVGIQDHMPNADDRMIDFYTLLGTIFGSAVNEEDVHNAWSVWQNGRHADHKSLIPFDQLTVEVQNLDTKYVEIIRKAVLDSQSID